MKKDTMPKPITGVYRRPGSTRWQLRIKVPADLTSLYPTEWACRVSLETSELREANERAAKLWAEWTARFDEQRRELKPQEAERITPELAQVLAQRVYARVLAGDEALRSNPEVAKALLLELSAMKTRRLRAALSIGGGTARALPVPAWADAEVDPLEGLPEPIAAELKELNAGMDADAACQLAEHARVGRLLPAVKHRRLAAFNEDEG